MSKPDRLSKKTLQADIESYAALLALEDYRPSNPEFSLGDVKTSQVEMVAKQTDEIQKQAAADAARDAADDGERRFHNMILGAKSQVKAQYGENSDQLASLGIKKKDEYRRPHRYAAKKAVKPI